MNTILLDESSRKMYDRDFTESRSEPRFKCSIPVEIKAGERVIRTETGNISLNGMQAILKREWGFLDGKEVSDVTCSMSLRNEAMKAFNLEIKAELKYAAVSGDTVYLGFLFTDLTFHDMVMLGLTVHGELK